MGIQIQPNCCPRHTIYNGSSRIDRFTGSSSDLKWTSAGATGFFDPTTNFVYGAGFPVVGVVRRKNKDASSPVTLVSDTTAVSFSLYGSVEAQKLLWRTNQSAGTVRSRLRMCDMDGSNVVTVQDITQSTTNAFNGAVINYQTEKVIYSKKITNVSVVGDSEDSIEQCNFDGSGVEVLVAPEYRAALTQLQFFVTGIDHETGTVIVVKTDQAAAKPSSVAFCSTVPGSLTDLKYAEDFNPSATDIRIENRGAHYSPVHKRIYFCVSDYSASPSFTGCGLWSCKLDGSDETLEVPIQDYYPAAISALPARFGNFVLGAGYYSRSQPL